MLRSCKTNEILVALVTAHAQCKGDDISCEILLSGNEDAERNTGYAVFAA